MSELTVILKDEERTYRHKFIIYENYTVTHDDPVILQCIDEAMKNFEGIPDEVQIKIHMEIQ